MGQTAERKEKRIGNQHLHLPWHDGGTTTTSQNALNLR